MLSKHAFIMQLIVMFIIDGTSAECKSDVDCKNNGTCTTKKCICPTGFTGLLCEIQSIGLCSDNETTNNKSLFLITFGSGSSKYTNNTPSSFNFTTTYRQRDTPVAGSGTFTFLNLIVGNYDFWHTVALDHTANDTNGYMLFVDVSKNIESQIFNSTINDLSIGIRYEFSAYLANVMKKERNMSKPNLRFEVRDTSVQNPLLAQLSTGDIPDYDNMTWSKYGLSFIASNSSVVLLIISYPNDGDAIGNDIVIDDIELRVCSTINSSFCSGDCFPPIITLFPNALSLSTPAQFGRRQDFHINTNLQFNCTPCGAITTNWTILTCSSTACSNRAQLNQLVDAERNDLFIPAHTLAYGIYELKLTVTLIALPELIVSSSVYIKIIASTIAANLIPYGTSVITYGYQQDLILDPGRFSISLNEEVFNANNWNYTYYCRIYDLYKSFIHQDLKLFEDPNQNCFQNQSDSWKYGTLLRSSVTIFGGSLKVNYTYQFKVQMIDLEKHLDLAIGYLLVHIESTNHKMIISGCIISKMCSPNLEYLYINPSTQVALFSQCLDNCSSFVNITWSIYQGSMNSSTNIVQWISFNHRNSTWFFGVNTNNLTVLKDIFIENDEIIYWRFEVIYSFLFERSLSAINFEINHSPKNGSCTINPQNGTTMTLFTINCSNWIDQDDIKDYSFYGWAKDSSNKMMIGFTNKSIYQLKLPATIYETISIHIIVHIRDTLDCVTVVKLSSVTVFSDLSEIKRIIEILQEPNTDSISELLEHADQKTIGQIVTSLSHLFNELEHQRLKFALANGIPVTRTSVTPLDNKNLNIILNSSNDSSDIKLNKYVNVCEQLMIYVNNLQTTNSDDVKFQSSIVAQLTQITNQLTRKTLVLASNKCHQLSQFLESRSTKISSEDVQLSATYIIQCIANVINAINGPLQGRTDILNLDLIRSNEETNDDCNPISFQNENDYLSKVRNMCYQKETANLIFNQMSEIISSLTSALKIHLNINQSIIINTSSVYFSLEKITTEYLSNRTINHIHLPSNFNLSIKSNSILLIRSMIEPLSLNDNYQIPSFTNLSRSISFSILDENGKIFLLKQRMGVGLIAK